MTRRHHPVRMVHHSLRYDATERRLVAALEHDIRHGDIVTVTEAGSPRVQRILRATAYAHGWRLYSPSSEPGMDETAVLWDPTVLELRHADTFQPTRRRLDTHRGGRLWVHALLFAIVGHPAAEFWTVAGHAPAHVEGRGGFRGLARWLVSVAVYRAYLAGVRRRMRTRVPRVYGFDWNLDWLRAWVRGYLNATLPGTRAGWRPPLPHGGTHGRRLIDGHRSKGLRLLHPSRRLRKFPGLDHRAVLTSYGVPDPVATHQ